MALDLTTHSNYRMFEVIVNGCQMKRCFASALSAVFLSVSALTAMAAELIMIDQTGCHYCESWTEEIGPIYPKTAEGKFAPLRRINIRAIPDELELTSRPAFTPTFILVEDNKELGRLEGYPGEDFFWPLVAELLKKSPNYSENGS
jgi:hypothetical protein